MQRADYLRALGLESWRRRDAGEPAPAPGSNPLPNPEPAPRLTSPLLTSPPLTDATATASAAPQSCAPQAEPTTRAMSSRQIPTDWPGLQAAVAGCQACKLCGTRTRTVFGVGVVPSALMVVGEAPGADEDAQGEPFVGRAGRLLDEMLSAIGHTRRDNVFIANVLKCRPPGNRDPESEEVEACRPYLDCQIEHVRPRLILGLGRIAAQRLLASDQPLSRLRGPLHHYGPLRVPTLITYHPAYLLRSPREKAKSWQDLKQVWRLLRDAPV